MADINRRDFLKVLGISGTASACTIDPVTPVEKVLPYVVTPDQIIPGIATYFATQCTACEQGCGVLAKNREGRIINLAGNPEHPTNEGSICARGIADLQATYSPDRFEGPMIAGKPAGSWDEGIKAAAGAIKAAKSAGKDVVWLGRHRTGATAAVVDQVMGALGAKVLRWEPLGTEALRTASKAVFGVDTAPQYALDQAQTIVSFGADFLKTWGNPSHSRGFADSRDPSKCGFVSQFWAVEPRLSGTSVNADIHLSPNPGTEAGVALAVAKLLAAKKGYSGAASALLSGVDAEALISASGVRMERITELVERLADHDSVVMPAGTTTVNEEAVNIASLVLNEVAGNIGNSVFFGPVNNSAGLSSFADVASTLAKAENIGVLLVDDLDIAFTTPQSVGKAALGKVGQVISFGNEPSETLTDGAIVLPSGSTLESWGDNEAILGRNTLQQPAMKPIKDTQSVGDSVLALAKVLGVEGTEEAPLADDFVSFLQGWWQANVLPEGDFASAWRDAVQTGGHFRDIPATGAEFQLAALPSAGSASKGTTLALFAHPFLYDGRHANRPWAQEVPEPVTGHVWGSWAEISPAMAESLGLVEGDNIKLTTDAGSIEVGFFASPGIHEEMVAVVMGNGHEGGGRYADLAGANPLHLLSEMQYAGASVTVAKAGKNTTMSSQIGNLDQDHRPITYVVKAKDIGTGKGAGGLVHLHHPPIDERITENNLLDMYPEPEHPTYRFAMAVDNNRCNGCGACEAACYAENNIAVVGPEQSRRGRHMGWVRLSRYWEGSGEEPDVRFQMTICQQCSHAPCEGVCPVLATYHNLDGLNAMIYNRCVGTRYCANNCPYSARRFNYHTFDWPEPFHMMLNPDVMTRTMGVMEKCTFCVQRIRNVKDTYRDVGQVAPDEALVNLPACVAACPSEALTFGNAKDPESTVSKMFNDERAYPMLAELNTKPGVRYLARISHSEVETGHGGGH